MKCEDEHSQRAEDVFFTSVTVNLLKTLQQPHFLHFWPRRQLHKQHFPPRVTGAFSHSLSLSPRGHAASPRPVERQPIPFAV